MFKECFGSQRCPFVLSQEAGVAVGGLLRQGLQFRALATGNVLPFGSILFAGPPRGVAIAPTPLQMVVAGSPPTETPSNEVGAS